MQREHEQVAAAHENELAAQQEYEADSHQYELAVALAAHEQELQPVAQRGNAGWLR